MKAKNDVGHRIRVISNLIKRQLHPNDGELTGIQMHILGYIYCLEGKAIQKDIENRFNIRRSTATGILKNLEKNGYITREISKEDSRIKTISLTDKAENSRKSLEKDIIRIEKLITDGLSDNDITEFFRITGIIKNNLEGNGKND